MSLPPFTSRAAMALLLSMGARAAAQGTDSVPSFELERLESNVGRGTVLMGNGQLMSPGGFNLNLLGHYQHLPLVLGDGEEKLEIVQSRVTTLLSGSYGLLSWLEVGAQVPIVIWQQGQDPGGAGLARLTSQGLGTPVIQARFGLMSQLHRKPVDLAADVAFGLPLGTGSALAGDPGPRFQGRMTMGKTFGWLHPALEAGVLFRPNIPLDTASGPAKPGAGSEIHLGASLTTTGSKHRGELSLRTTVGSAVSTDVLGGIRFPVMRELEAFVLGGPGIGQAPGTPLFRVLAGITFRSEPLPPVSYLDEVQDRDITIVLAERRDIQAVNRVQPVANWELTGLGRKESELPTPPERRPFQPGLRDKVLLSGEVHFAQGITKLPGVVPLLDQAALRLLESTRGGSILVEGHADPRESELNDMTVSFMRAHAVRLYLINQGIPSERVTTHVFGSDFKLSDRPTTEQEHQLNRRIEIFVITEAETRPNPVALPVP